MSFRSLTKNLGKKARNLSRSARRSLSMGDVSSDSASDDELGILPYNPDLDTQLQERKRRYEETGRQRAESPTDDQSAYMERKRRRKDEIKREALQQSADIQTRNENAVNQMIENINLALRTNVGNTDPVIRFVIRQIINAHGLTLKSIALMAQSRILLSALGEAAVRSSVNTGIAISTAGQRTLDFLRRTGQLVYSGASMVASSLPNMGAAVLSHLPSLSRRLSLQQRAQVQGPQLDPAMPSGFREAASRQQVANDALMARHLGNLDAEIAAFANFESDRNAVSARASAPPPLPPPPPPPPARALDAEEDICTICMAGPGINDSGIDSGPLGYIESHDIRPQGHPNKFHNSCLQECLRLDPRCPMCRTGEPIWGTQPPPGQGGGGLKKYRSRSRSKSKSKPKTRRLRKSRKPRKSRKSRKPRSSSRRK